MTEKLFLVVLVISSLSFSLAQVNKQFLPGPTERTPLEALDKWIAMEKQIKKSIANMVNEHLMPMLGDSELDLTADCSNDLLEALIDLQDLKLWAIKLFDASAKPLGGEFYGRLGTYGSYDECFQVQFPVEEDEDPADKTVGKYCLLDIRTPLPPKTRRIGLSSDIFEGTNITFKYQVVEEMRKNSKMYYDYAIRMGVCIPSTCTTEDLKKMFASGIGDSGVTAVITSCEIKEPKVIDTVQQIIIALFALVGLINAISLLLDTFILKSEVEVKERSIVRYLLRTFNPARNLEQTLETSPEDGNILHAIHGIRTFTMFWVILSQTYVSIDIMILSNLIEYEKFAKSWIGLLINNGASAVDTFFLLTGVLLAYHIIRDVDQRGSKSFSAATIIFRRILRFLPSMMVVLGITIIYPLLNEGPLWKNSVGQFAVKCRSNWWAMALFINNIFSLDEMCMPHTWYLSVDMQCLLIIMVYFYLIFKKPVLAKMYLVFLIAGSAASCAVVTFYLDLLPTTLIANSDIESFLKMSKYRYTQVYSRIGVYAIGVALGTFLARRTKFTISKPLIGACWALSASAALGVIFSIHDWNSGAIMQPIHTAVYAGAARLAWGLAVAWVIFICEIGKGGIVNEFLSWSGFQPLSKVSYLTYLMYLPIMYGYGATRHTTVGFSHLTFVWLFFGHLTACYMAGLGIRIFFQAPVDKLINAAFAWLWAPSRSSVQDNGTRAVVEEIYNNNSVPETNGGTDYGKMKENKEEDRL